MTDALARPPAAAAPSPAALRDLALHGVVAGIGAAGNLDQIVLHELLQWHNLYTHTGPFWRLFVDGLFHLAMVGVLAAGLLGVWGWQRRHPGRWRADVVAAGVLLGAGGFNLFDGTVNHKLLRLHQVREGVANLWLYDAVFLGLALLVFAAGWALWRRARRRA